MPDFLVLEAGIIYGGCDREWFYKQTPEVRKTVITYLTARKEKGLMGASCSPMQASDLVHLVSMLLDGKKKGASVGHADLTFGDVSDADLTFGDLDLSRFDFGGQEP